MQRFTSLFYYKVYVLLVAFAAPFLVAKAQSFNPVTIDGLSTGSVYDLMTDSRGFLWVAHETGISRYDGNSFTHFHCDEETSLAMTDIIEDNYGRVWCHNFNGQLFYIHKEKMFLLKAYDHTKERNFQRLVLLGDELIATSSNGVFVCNTANLSSRFIKDVSKESFTRSIAVVGGKVVAVGSKWFIYKKEKGLSELKVDATLFTLNFTLQPLVTKDTIYSMENINGKFCASKLIIRGDSVIVASRMCYNDRLNSITQDDNRIIINTKVRSEYSTGEIVVNGYDLTDRVTDKYGNKWYSSLQRGLLCERNSGKWERLDFSELEQGDYIKSLSSIPGSVVYGTNNGYLFFKDAKTGEIIKHVQIDKALGSVQNIFRLCQNILIITPSIGLLLYDTETGKLREIFNHGTVKEVSYTNKEVLLAYSDSLTVFPLTSYSRKLFQENESVDIDQAADDCIRMVMQEKAIRKKRCRYVCYDKKSDIVYSSFLDGLFSWSNGQFDLLHFDNNPTYAISLVQSVDKIIFSTFSGLFFIENKKIYPFNRINEFRQEVVTSLKTYKQYLFLIKKDELQVFDVRTQALLNIIPLPDNYNGLVYNIEMVDNKLFLANASGLYRTNFTSIRNKEEPPLVNYLLSVTANNRNITYADAALKTSENNLRFTFDAPNYVFPGHTFFYYQLKGSGDTSWHKMPEKEFTLSFASLKPGDYTLNAYAVNYRMQKAQTPISFHFIINKPWWLSAWFIGLAIIVFIAMIYVSLWYRFRLMRKRSREKELRQQEFERALLQSQIAVQEQERKRIAEDLHDDIGATLSALHLHISNIPEKTLNQSEELQQFNKQALLLASKAANDVRGISHDLLPKDFSELGLFAVIQNRIDELNAANAIRFTFITDGNEKLLNNLYSITIYRIVNELLSNMIRHSQAQQGIVQLLINETETQVIAEDNGIGIHSIQKRGIGMKNIQSRVDFLKGKLHIDSSDKGTVIIIAIPTNPVAHS